MLCILCIICYRLQTMGIYAAGRLGVSAPRREDVLRGPRVDARFSLPQPRGRIAGRQGVSKTKNWGSLSPPGPSKYT